MPKRRRNLSDVPLEDALFSTKHRKRIPHEFVLEALAPLSPRTNPMFGCLAVYAGEKIMLILRDKSERTEDNGVWLATTEEHHESLRREFPSMRSIGVLGKKVTGWQVLPAEAPDFEAAALRACELILAGDARIGKVPGARPPRSKSAAKGRKRSQVRPVDNKAEEQQKTNEAAVIIFHIPGPLRSFSGGRNDVELKAPVGTVSEALQALWVACPGMRDRVVTEQGQVREHINIFVGKENIRYTGGLATPVSAGSEISIVPAISGGRTAEEPEPGRASKGLNPFANVAGKKYMSLASFRKNGQAVRTPLWFAEQDAKLYCMTRDDSWKSKRLRNNPRVLVAPCTMRGRITGPDVEGRARVLEPWEFPAVQRALERKYWLMRLPFWSKHNVFLEITAG